MCCKAYDPNYWLSAWNDVPAHISCNKDSISHCVGEEISIFLRSTDFR